MVYMIDTGGQVVRIKPWSVNLSMLEERIEADARHALDARVRKINQELMLAMYDSSMLTIRSIGNDVSD